MAETCIFSVIMIGYHKEIITNKNSKIRSVQCQWRTELVLKFQHFKLFKRYFTKLQHSLINALQRSLTVNLTVSKIDSKWCNSKTDRWRWTLLWFSHGGIHCGSNRDINGKSGKLETVTCMLFYRTKQGMCKKHLKHLEPTEIVLNHLDEKMMSICMFKDCSVCNAWHTKKYTNESL